MTTKCMAEANHEREALKPWQPRLEKEGQLTLATASVSFSRQREREQSWVSFTHSVHLS